MKNTIAMLRSVSGGQMNSFVVTTRDGKVLVIDGGYRCDALSLLDYLREVTGAAIPHVDAWIHTHAHGDHIEAFIEMMENHRDKLTVGKIYYNFPSAQFLSREPGYGRCILDFNRLLPLFAHKVETVYRGDEYRVGDAHIEILYSPSGELPGYINNTSVVFMLTLGGKKILFLGDAEPAEGERLLALYKGTGKLCADYVQMAHHGQGGVEKDVYAEISPKACFWCAPGWLWDNDAGGGFNTHVFKTVTVRGWMEELGVYEHFVLKDGTQVVEL
jgi:beta-lactamase superfamily II metal-dependent hydrolase